MRKPQPLRRFKRERQRIEDIQRLSGELFRELHKPLQIPPFTVFHRIINPTPFFRASVVERDDVGMSFKPGRDLDFPAESFDQAAVDRQVRGQQLHRFNAVAAAIAHCIDRTHGAGANTFEHDVVAQQQVVLPVGANFVGLESRQMTASFQLRKIPIGGNDAGIFRLEHLEAGLAEQIALDESPFQLFDRRHACYPPYHQAREKPHSEKLRLCGLAVFNGQPRRLPRSTNADQKIR